jgi:hypothetical protein
MNFFNRSSWRKNPMKDWYCPGCQRYKAAAVYEHAAGNAVYAVMECTLKRCGATYSDLHSHDANGNETVSKWVNQ